MEQTGKGVTDMYIASVPGLDTIIVPREGHDDPRWEDSDSSGSLPNKLRRHPQHARNPIRGSVKAVQAKPGRSWWMRLLVDSMLIPFAQGFMLNMGVHWIQYWRRTGGVLGVFRRWRISNKGQAIN
ncbi:hypothetical protein LPJ59_001445 [Coemansia sp. RSA 2399]|nr:hypothetical protein LPJ59_001445 [Coemansia sp. RSA 2399]KAJ1906570.1 hypothetical protein LPJ81_001281 [Coemansia sp. IMI 209127]